MRRITLTTLVATAAVAIAATTIGIVATTASSSGRGRTTAASSYDISIGDSYSVGYQNPGLVNSPGFTGYVAKKEKLVLANFGCSGATTTSILTQTGCPGDASAPAASGGITYPTTDQVAAVLHFVDVHPGKVALVTVSIGGNDVTSCVTQPPADVARCVATASTTIAANVGNLVAELDDHLRTAGDTGARIVGTTYPDVILGDWVAPVGSTDPLVAELSIVAFDELINPTLHTAYTSVARGSFVDVTDARYGAATAGDDTGTFTSNAGSAPFSYHGPREKLAGLSRSAPAAVVEVCTLTWYCNTSTFGDIHANTKGYDFIGSLIVADLKAH
jgi:lysophospholipase L1-like esterase